MGEQIRLGGEEEEGLRRVLGGQDRTHIGGGPGKVLEGRTSATHNNQADPGTRQRERRIERSGLGSSRPSMPTLIETLTARSSHDARSGCLDSCSRQPLCQTTPLGRIETGVASCGRCGAVVLCANGPFFAGHWLAGGPLEAACAGGRAARHCATVQPTWSLAAGHPRETTTPCNLVYTCFGMR
jgi:hypothetical protein